MINKIQSSTNLATAKTERPILATQNDDTKS